MWTRGWALEEIKLVKEDMHNKLGGAGSGRRNVSIVDRYMRDRIEEIKVVKAARANTECYQHHGPNTKPAKKVDKWAKWHTAWPHGEKGDRASLSEQAQATWAKFKRISGRV